MLLKFTGQIFMEMRLSDICSAVNGKILSGSVDSLLRSVSTDSRKDMHGSLFVALKGENFDGHDFIEHAFDKGAEACLVEKTSSVKNAVIERFKTKTIIEVESTLEALGDLACWWRKKFAIKIAAITGSNGKTTTKEMVWNILKQISSCLKNKGNQNNLIGVPLSLFELSTQHEKAVLELGTNQKGEIRRLSEICSPDVGLITNIAPSHLEGLKSLNNIMEEKGCLFESLPSDGTAVINADDEMVLKAAHKSKADKLFFGFEKGDIKASNIREDNRGKTLFTLQILDKSRTIVLPVPGRHSVGNALAASAVSYSLGADIETIGKGLECFVSVPGRMEIIDINGIKVINDSYNANPASMEASLKTLSSLHTDGKRVAVLGDMLELGKDSELFHHQLGQMVAALGINTFFFAGKYSAYVKTGALSGGIFEENILASEDLPALSNMLKEKILPGDTVLLKGSRKMGIERVIDILKKQ